MILEFIEENFLYLHPGYTLLNTIVFGIILGLAILIIIRMFKWLQKDPGELLLALVPFIFFGSSARALVDNGLYPLTLLLVTPGLYVLTGLITITALLLSVFMEKKMGWDYRYTLFSLGSFMCLFNLVMIEHINPVPLLQILGAWALISAPFIFLRNKWWLLKDKFNLSVLIAHLLDASTTFIAVDFYGYGEQHVLPNFLTQMVDTAVVMFPLKITVILTVLYIIDTSVEDKTTRNMLKLAIFVLGLAPGLRNFLSLIMGS
ncbi:MAG: DUF63 family protein [Euryarchaeota archaeon]|jgi:uncharacterized membrane protein|nr:DUF63 family protein [Euryarchaeota archaeon]HNS24519.1 DUF63 family protein [Methanobacteriaceae archaeon]